MNTLVRRLWPSVLLCFLLAPSVALGSKQVARKLKGRIILSQKPFPTSFKNDRSFVKHMKRVDTKRFVYGDSEKISVEFMAFFARSYAVTEFTATVFDVTERREMVTTFPIYPQQRKTQILASYFSMDKASFEVEHQYLMVVQSTYGGPVIAEAKFAIKAK